MKSPKPLNLKAKKYIPSLIFLALLIPTVSHAGEPNRTQLSNLRKLLESRDCQSCDLGNVNLSNRDLKKAVLRQANLENANLENAKLDQAQLEKANLSDADLEGAELSKAKLRDADLSNANLSGANLSGADLRGANLSQAKNLSSDALKYSVYNQQTQFPPDFQPNSQTMYKIVPGTVLPVGANLQGVDLSGENLKNSVLIEVNLQEAELIGINLSGAVLIGARLCKAQMLNADLRGANLSFANLTNTDLTYAKLSPRYYERLKQDLNRKLNSGVELEELPRDYAWTKLKGAFLANTILNDADLSQAYLVDAELKGTLLRRANLSEVDFLNATLYKVDFSGLSGAELHNPSLIGKIGTNLAGANFKEATVKDSDLRGTNLQGTGMNSDFLKIGDNWFNGATITNESGRISIATSENPQVFKISNAGIYTAGEFPEDKKMLEEIEKKKMDECTTETQFKNNPQSANDFSL